MKSLAALLIAFSSLAFVTPVRAQAVTEAARTPLTLSLDLQTQWRLDPSYRLFSATRDAGSTGLSLSYDVWRRGRSVLAIGLGYQGDSATAVAGGGGDVFDETNFAPSNRASLDTQTVGLSVLARWSVRSWLEPLVRASVDGT